MNQKMILAASVAAGLLAFLLSWQFLARRTAALNLERERLYAGARKVDLVVARRTLPQGTVIQKEDLAVKPFMEREASISERAVLREDAEMLLGRKILFRVEAEKPILWSDIEGGGLAGRSLASIVQPGLRAVSLAIAGAAAVSQMVQPNDRVDVLGTFELPGAGGNAAGELVTLTVLQDVTVLATGQQMAQAASRARAGMGGYSTVTLLVTPREAEVLVFAQQIQGRLYLTLRNPSDVSYEKNLPTTDFEQIQSKLPELNQYRQKNVRSKSDM